MLMEELLRLSITLKLIAVLFILTVVLNRSMNRTSRWVISCLLLISAGMIHYFRVGYAGILFTASGAGIAYLLTLPLERINRISREDLIVSTAIGGVLGAVGYALCFLICLVLFAVQQLMKAEKSSLLDWFFTRGTRRNVNVIMQDEKSALALIEAKKIMSRECEACRGVDLNEIGICGNLHQHRGQWRNDFLTWCEKLALAALTVLMAGYALI